MPEGASARSSRDRGAARLRAQLLTARDAVTPEEVVERLLAVQAQDARGFRLAVRARSTGLRAADVDAGLTERRTLVVSWLCRGTLHLVGADDYWWLHDLTASRVRPGVARRLRQLGVTEALADRGVEVVLDEVARGPRTRESLAAALAEAGVPTAGQALVHVLAEASLRAHLVRGPVVEGRHCFVDATRWLARPAALGPEDALARLARRYLEGHGPAAPEDLAAYAGITLGAARRAFALVEDETAVAVGGGRAPRGAEVGPLPAPRLLGMFDPVLHGWADREWVVGGHGSVVTTNGLFRASALVRGRVAGLWSLERGAVSVRLLERPGRADVDALGREAGDVLAFLGLPEADVRLEVAAPG